MRMQDKAKANLDAARVLAERGWFDAAANRAYFALFQAGVAWMQRMGRRPEEFTRGATRWQHATIVGNASLYRRRLADIALFRELRALRVQADYGESRVAGDRVRAVLGKARELIEEVCR
jgi:uncharacterized protein (UPF0332 family)